MVTEREKKQHKHHFQVFCRFVTNVAQDLFGQKMFVGKKKRKKSCECVLKCGLASASRERNVYIVCVCIYKQAAATQLWVL